MIFREVEQKIIKIINESGMPIDAIYFIMKSIMQEIEEKYYDFCRKEDMAVMQEKLQTEKPKIDEEVEKQDLINENEERAN